MALSQVWNARVWTCTALHGLVHLNTWSSPGVSALGTFKRWGRAGESRLLGRGTRGLEPGSTLPSPAPCLLTRPSQQPWVPIPASWAAPQLCCPRQEGLDTCTWWVALVLPLTSPSYFNTAVRKYTSQAPCRPVLSSFPTPFLSSLPPSPALHFDNSNASWSCT